MYYGLKYGSWADWVHRGDYILAKHGITPAQADEALADPDAFVQQPDPASNSGVSDRTIGMSPSFGALLSVITVEEDGVVWGINAWKSNDTDIRKCDERCSDDG